MSVVPFLAEDIDACEAGRRAAHMVGDHEAAAALSWLASRMRVERQMDMVQEAVSTLAERRIQQYGSPEHHEQPPQVYESDTTYRTWRERRRLRSVS